MSFFLLGDFDVFGDIAIIATFASADFSIFCSLLEAKSSRKSLVIPSDS